MSDLRVYQLKIDGRFSKLIPPLSAAEFEQLEINILRDGCREPLCVWNNTIIDGHNRYRICQAHQIPFRITRMQFVSVDDVTAWICDNQLGRRNISEEMRRYLIGKRYEAEKTIGARNIYGRNQHSAKEVSSIICTNPPKAKNVYRTAEKLGEEYHISHGTVLKYGAYARAVDALSKTAPDIVPKILSGRVKMSQENVMDLAQLPTRAIRKFESRLGEKASDTYIKYSDVRDDIPEKPQAEKPHPSVHAGASIKDMPEYDPDAEVTSLAYTIPSWIGAIERARSITVIPQTSDKARKRLSNELVRLCESAVGMIAVLKEEK